MDKTLAHDQLIARLCDIQDKKEMSWLLQQLLTQAEIEDVIDRIRIYTTLANTKSSQRDISKKLQVSITKVTRGAANLHNSEVNAYFSKHFELP